MKKFFTKFLILYSIAVTVVLIKYSSEQEKVISLGGNEPLTQVITKEIIKKEIVYKEPKIQGRVDKKSSSAQVEAEEETEEVGAEILEDPIANEKEQKQQELNHDVNSEKTLAFFEQAMGVDFTPQQEQKALSALRAYDEADPTAVADADTAFLDRRLKLSADQKAKIRKAITEFNYEPEEISDQIAENNQPQETEGQNQEYYDHVSPFLDEKQKAALLEMMNQGIIFMDE